MVYSHTKNPNLGIFWRALEWKTWVQFIVIWNILWPFVIFNGHFGNFPPFWYIESRKIWQPGYKHADVAPSSGQFIAKL
jgi:hypothetical protein